MDKVSIVVAVYNAEKTLKKCVESLLNQTYNNIEIILVNDCSKDNSLDICTEYSKTNENVKVISNEKNSGVSATRNNGINNSTGEYICFVDSDDYVEKDYVEILLNALVNNNLQLSICGCEYHNFIDGITEKFLWKNDESIEVVSLARGFELNDALYLNALWNKLFVTRLIKNNNIFFDVNLSMGEDAKFSLEYIKYNNITSVVIISKPLYHYIRWTDSSLMSNYCKQIDGEYLENLKLLFGIVKPLNCDAKKLYDSAEKSLKNTLKYNLLRSNLPKADKNYYIKILYPDYSFGDRVSDTFLIVKEKIVSFLHR